MPASLSGLRLGFLVTLALPAVAQAPAVQRLPDGILVYLPPARALAVRTVRLQVVAGNIVHVRSSPLDSASTAPSLMAVAPQGPGAWQFKQKNGEATLSTATLNATVSLATGAVTSTDKKGNVLLAEPAGGGASFVPV